jgi:alkanesulfonate monooxygenase SsuD/methylene tetrahydromethanopterin reductase-like flavin-dependent oxidoreductase (luciferase family)
LLKNNASENRLDVPGSTVLLVAHFILGKHSLNENPPLSKRKRDIRCQARGVMKRPIKFGINLPGADFGKALALAQKAEKAGYFSVSVSDHLFTHLPRPASMPLLECFTTLGALASATSKIRLNSAVVCYLYRNPALLAKMISSLDNISGGRFIVGLGSGWVKEECDAYGYPFPSDRERVDQLEDTVKLMKVMFTRDEATYHGRFNRLTRPTTFPNWSRSHTRR